jgi:hypothetical protein
VNSATADNRKTHRDDKRRTALSIDWSIKMTDLAIVFATLIGPILAVWASEWRAQQKGAKDRKEWVFRTLMSTRGAKLRQEHVAAINHIEFAFPRQSCPTIDDARSMYRKHLKHPDSIAEDFALRAAWANKANDLFADLLYRMATDLKIPFTKTEIVEESYLPDAHVFSEQQWQEIRWLTLDVLKHGRPIHIRPIIDPPAA